MEEFVIENKKVSLISAGAGVPLAVISSFEDRAQEFEKLASALGLSCSLLIVSNLIWEDDLSPWEAPSLNKHAPPFKGKADEYLKTLLTLIIPKAETLLACPPASKIIAGYSLAGLFAIYALYRCPDFKSAACASGSLWFPDFVNYALSHKLKSVPQKLYFSVGDAENRTRHPLLRQVHSCTQNLSTHYKTLGINTCFELNPGNHFTDPNGRLMRGLSWLLNSA